MNPSITIVSACDRNFLWGAYLLVASAARNVPGTPVNLLQTGFSEHEIALLRQFPDARVLPLANDDPRCVANRKAEALLSADTDYVAWLDADCFIIGDIRKYLIPTNGEFQIRLREPWENAWVWRNHYAAGESRDGLPLSVAERWRADVGQSPVAHLQTTCVTNAFVLHRRHLGFIREWQAQIAKVIPPVDAGPVDKSSPAYFMTDESVFTSLLAFSHAAPPIAEIRLNRDPEAHVAHFGANPKPWKRWRKHLWYCHRHVLDLIDWAQAAGYRIPPVPWSFRRRSRLPAYLMASGEDWWLKARAAAAKLVRNN
jgi:hypothetical protein